MEEFQRRLARLGLRAAARSGLALAGGQAIVLHGFVQRPTNDVDLFTALDADLQVVVRDVTAAYEADGLEVSVDHDSPHYVRLTVTDSRSNEASKVELVADVRLHAPVQKDIGPVLHPDDVAAGKVEALFTRAECRDFIDVTALLQSGRYDEEDLLSLAEQRDAGFDRQVFADMLLGVNRFPALEFARYGVEQHEADRIRQLMAQWRERLINNR